MSLHAETMSPECTDTDQQNVANIESHALQPMVTWELISRFPRIYRCKDFLTAEECEHVIQAFVYGAYFGV